MRKKLLLFGFFGLLVSFLILESCQKESMDDGKDPASDVPSLFPETAASFLFLPIVLR